MISKFSARRGAEEFAAAVDDDRTPRSDEVVTLLQLVASLRAVEPAAPRPEFTEDLRGRLMAEAETTLKPDSAKLLLPARERGRRERRLVAAATAFVLVGGTTTVAAAAQSSLPGETLYPIKRGIERAEVGLSTSPEGRARDLLSQATHRLEEVQGLTDADPLEAESRIPATLEEFSASADEGAQLMFESFRQTADPETVTTVRAFAVESMSALKALSGSVPDDAQDELAEAAVLVRDLDEEASALCGNCASDLPAVEVPGIFLARAEVDRALALAARRDLTNSHPVVVPRRALPADGRGSGDSAREQEPRTSDEQQLPAPSLSPDSWSPVLPDLDDGASGGGGGKDGSGPVGKVTEELEKGLTGVVETLLPDPDGGTADKDGSLLDKDGSLLDKDGALLDEDGGSLLD